MDGDEGTAGEPDEVRNTGGGVRVRGDDAERLVPVTAETIREMTVFQSLGAVAALLNEVSSPYGAANARGWDTENAYGPLLADASGFGPGSGGFGMVGTGRGACPVGATNCTDGTVGVGTTRTIGGGGGCSDEDVERFTRQYGRAGAMDRCSGTSMRVGNTGMTRGGRVPDPVRMGEAETVGGLSREQIRRVVRRNLPQVRACYEQTLVSRPDLEGRVSVQFIISPSGAVQSAAVAGSSVANTTMESCVAQAVRRWPFPATAGVTSVTYPFMFQRP
jgi:TonB family protein